MLPREGNLPGDTLFQLKQAVRIEIEAVMIMAQFVRGFAKLNRRFFEHIEYSGELTVHTNQLADQLLRGVELALQVGFFAVCQHRQRMLAGSQQLTAVSKAFVLFINLLKFARQRVELV